MRKLFCEISPLTYRISVKKERALRRSFDLIRHPRFANEKSPAPLPVCVSKHNSLIRRRLGDVDMRLQENKAVNLALAAPHVDGLVIRPGETFSFWHLVGDCTEKRGYKEGLLIARGRVDSGVGGGMCQFTNLVHWMVLHSPLTVIEHHHHNDFDLFPDFGRQVPFGTGTSIIYNYRDYRFRNDTDNTFQLLIKVEDDLLCGELRAVKPVEYSYHIYETDSRFTEGPEGIFRHNKVWRRTLDKKSGNTLEETLLLENRSKVLYDRSFIDEKLFAPPLTTAGS